ncbi:hypothetical protein Hanom_Chr10g00944211 [Helianthus anomalus]
MNSLKPQGLILANHFDDVDTLLGLENSLMGGIFFSSNTHALYLFFSSIKNPNSPFPSITAPFPFTRSLQAILNPISLTMKP